MMKLNNRGFAITSVLYGLLILFVLLTGSYLSILGAKKNRLDVITSDIEKRYAFENKLEGSSITISGDSFEAPCVGKYILGNGLGNDKSVYLYKGKTYKISDFGATSIKEVWCQGSGSNEKIE